MKRFLLLLLASLCCLQIDAVWAKQQALIVDTPAISPFGFAKDGKDTGINYEIANLICERARLECKNTIVPYARAKSEVLNGSADLTIMFSNLEFDKTNAKLVEILQLNTIIVGRKGVSFSDQKALSGKVVATLRGSFFEPNFAQDASIKKELTRDYNEGLKLLFNDSVDAIVGSEYGIFFTARQMGFEREKFGKPLNIVTQYMWLMCSPKVSADLRGKLSTAVAELKKEGAFERIAKRYMSE